MNANLDFNVIYNLLNAIISPLKDLLSNIKINGTSILIILLTLFLILKFFVFIVRAKVSGSKFKSNDNKKGGE